MTANMSINLSKCIHVVL